MDEWPPQENKENDETPEIKPEVIVPGVNAEALGRTRGSEQSANDTETARRLGIQLASERIQNSSESDENKKDKFAKFKYSGLGFDLPKKKTVVSTVGILGLGFLSGIGAAIWSGIKKGITGKGGIEGAAGGHGGGKKGGHGH